ncbi:F(420)H(2) dehydrogenase subunit I [uncultured archaeon]|nr:F(420)H(2) dehydrogenase subunit I [uncultured archaeon]
MQRFNKFILELDRLISPESEYKRKSISPGLLNSLLPAYPVGLARRDMGKKSVDETLCTECGLCEKLCPYEAIKCSPKPVFDMAKCYGCWRCYNHCPVKAIYTKKYRGAGHYPHPISQLEEKLKV